MSLDNVSTEQLKQEIKRREEKAKALADAERAGRAIEVVCPGCNGKTKIMATDGQSGYGYEEDCHTCNGKGFIVALRRFPKELEN
jgi:DnaJ-class molecular chaperone